MAFGQDFVNSFFGNDYLKDYAHASKTFTSAGYQNAPRFKFLYHVFFNINTGQLPGLQANPLFSTSDVSTFGLLVKNIELPKFRIDTETLNQYNRKRVVQKKIEYQPVRCVFHDDGGDAIRRLWYNYFAYYYKDASQKYNNVLTGSTTGQAGTNANGFDYNVRDIYDSDRKVNDWGYIGETYGDNTQFSDGKPLFFRDITIYGFNQHKYVWYTLINPLINEWNHDTYDYATDGGTMENSMTISYETVKYGGGAIGNTDTGSAVVPGFGDPAYYDKEPSPLSRPGGTQSYLGQGGLLDAAAGIATDLSEDSFNPLSALRTAGTALNTFRGRDLVGLVKEEAIGGLVNNLRSVGSNTNRAQPNGATTIQNKTQAPVFNVPPRTYNN